MGSKAQTVKDVQRKIRSFLPELRETEEVSLIQAGQRVLAENIQANSSSPPFPRSPYDGYAVRAEDIKDAGRTHPVNLTVVDKIFAGEFPEYAIHKGQAARIMTGAPVPDGADTVVKQEDTDYGERNVKIYTRQDAYVHYCMEGEDFQKGEVLLKKGIRMNAFRIGIAAAAGYRRIQVRRKAEVAVLTTGNELCKPGVMLKPGKIYNSSLYMLAERIRELGGEIAMAEQIPDEEEMIRNQLKQAVQIADFVVMTGGISVGEKDLVKDVLKKEGAEFLADGIFVKPGAPTAVSVLNGKMIVSLSGNPFAAVVHMELLVRYALACMLGCEELLPEEQSGILEGSFQKVAQRDRYIRGKEAGGRIVIPDEKERSGILSSMDGCNCLVKIEKGREYREEGEKIWYIRIQ